MQFEPEGDHPYLCLDSGLNLRKSNTMGKDKANEKEDSAVNKSISAAAELSSHFLDDLGCVVCTQIPLDLNECVNCNKILCNTCHEQIIRAAVTEDKLDCPNCKENKSFKF